MMVLIAGGAGFIGSHLVDYYLSSGYEVIAVDNLSTGNPNNISRHMKNPLFSFYTADLLCWPELEATVKKCDLIYDVAAIVGMFNVLQKPIATLHVNINITERILAAVAELKYKPPVIVASSSEVYGSSAKPMKENDILLIEMTSKAHASYPISKLCNEVAALAYYKEKEVPVIVVRLFNTVGPRQSARYGMVLPRFINQALTNQPLTIFADGKQTRSFCDVRDVCRMLHLLALSNTSIGEVVNVGSDKGISILSLANLVKEITQSQSILAFQQYESIYGNDYIDIHDRRPDLTKLKSLVDYSLHWQLKDTIKDIILAS